jgi:hypothetical protein
LVNPKAFTKTSFFTAFLQSCWGCLYSKTLFKSICSTPTPTLAQYCLIIQLKMSSMFPPAASSSLPLSVQLLVVVVAAQWLQHQQAAWQRCLQRGVGSGSAVVRWQQQQWQWQ